MNNVFKTIMNALSSPATSQSPAPPSGQPPAPVPANAIKDLDKFESKFSARPYFNSGFKRKNVGWTLDPKPSISTKLFKTVFDQAQPLFSGADLKTLAALKNQWDALSQKQTEIGFLSAQTIYRENQQAAGEKFLAGGRMEAAGLTATREGISSTRTFLHNEKMKISKAAYDLTKPACEKLAAARSLAELWDANGRDDHSLFADDGASAAPFIPSAHLRAFIFIALDLADAPIRNFELSGFMVPADVENLMALWFTPRVVSRPISPTEVNRQRDKLTADSIKQMERAAAENAKGERQKEVSEHNLFIEQIKKQAAANLESAKDIEATRAAEKDKRKADALLALNNPKPAASSVPVKPAEQKG